MTRQRLVLALVALWLVNMAATGAVCAQPPPVRNITRTSDRNEHSPQFSRDGRRLLYRRMPRHETIGNNHHGTQGALVLANSDGTNPQGFGGEGEYTWASWSPDGKQIACLSIKGISFIDVATKQVVRKLERKGFFQQVTWSPDGRWLCGVANSFGASWSIARMDAETGAASAVNRIDCCTPDWFPDSQNLIFSWRPPGQKVNNAWGPSPTCPVSSPGWPLLFHGLSSQR